MQTLQLTNYTTISILLA